MAINDESDDLESLVEIEKEEYLEAVCGALIYHQDAVQQLENTMLHYFKDDTEAHLAYYKNPETNQVFYKLVEPKLGYETDIQED